MNGVQIRVGDLLYAIGKRWKMILAFVLVGNVHGRTVGISAQSRLHHLHRLLIAIGSTISQQVGNHVFKVSTLEEVGQHFGVTRERIRQIEAKALRKLRHPSRSKRLKDFLE